MTNLEATSGEAAHSDQGNSGALEPGGRLVCADLGGREGPGRPARV